MVTYLQERLACREKLAQDVSLRAKALNVMHPAYIWPSLFVMYMTI